MKRISYFIQMLRLSIFIFPYRYDVMQNIKSFLGKIFFDLHTRGVIKRKSPEKWKIAIPRSLEGLRGKNVPSECHRFIVIHGGVRRRKRNLIRSDATSVRHLKLQPDLQSEST